MKVSYIPYDGRELNDIAFSKKYQYRWTNILKQKLEKEGHEIHTYDILPVEEADAILCFDNIYFQNSRHFKRLYDCNKLGCTTHIDYEPPAANCKIHDDKGLRLLSNLFKSLITYNDNVINGKTLVKGCIGDYLSSEQPYKKDFKKRKLVAVIANYRVGLMLFGQHPDELYSKRGESVEYFQTHCPKDFDLYGNYWPETHKISYKGSVERNKKLDVIKKYKFLISYDSICNQNGYISEKIFDCFKAKTVPIYWGADNVTDYIPKECFIDKRDFETYEELETFLRNITEKEYEKYINAIEKYLNSDSYKNLFSSEASADIIYKELMKPKRKINKLKAKSIISSFYTKRKNDTRYNYDNNYYDSRYPTEISLVPYREIENKPYKFEFILKTYVNKKYKNIKIMKKVANEYEEVNVIKDKKTGIYQAEQWHFTIPVDEIQEDGKLELYTYDPSTKKYKPLLINVIVDRIPVAKYFKLKINKNYFEKIYTKKEKINSFLKKYHLTYISKVVYRILKLPYVFLKQFIEVFK